MSTTLKLIEQSFDTTHQSLHTTGQHAAKKCQDHHKQMIHSNPLRNLNNYSEKAEAKPDAKNSIATDPLATKCAHWRVVYNEKLRKTNVWVSGIPQIVNILPLYEHYVCVTPCQVLIKGSRLNIQHNNMQNQDINLLIEIKEPEGQIKKQGICISS